VKGKGEDKGEEGRGLKDRGESVVARARMRTMIRVRVQRRGEERRAGNERVG
jgi:hypothetical protein